MPQTRMFRDRMVSMEQTLERGEKHLEFLKAICRRAFPDFEYREHLLDHERDLFVMVIASADGRRRSIGWTRMVLFDAERLPALIANPDSDLAEKMVTFLKDRSGRPEIVVTFRHLEDGWVDSPEPRREKRRGRRGRGDSRGRRDERRTGVPQPGGRPPGPPPGPPPQRRDREIPAAANRPPTAPGGESTPGQRPGGRRRRFRRRRGRRGGGGSNPASRPAPTT
ncbi:MAG TPA: hypothetical protein VJA66_11585 [Thermoanaerobaculia bacterium]